MLRSVVRTAAISAAALLLVAADADAQWARFSEPMNQVRFRLGIFEPSGDSDGWDRVFEGFTGEPSDLQDLVWGADYLLRTSRHTGLLLGFSFMQGATTSGYTDWVASDGSEIRHTTELELADLTAAFVWRPGGGAVRPYLGAGGGLVFYTLTDEGNFIDFGSPDLPVVWAWYGAEGDTFELFALAGVDIPIGSFWSFFVEGRYRWASDTLGDDYSGFGELDLGGWEISGGFGFDF
ncbi:MAG: hypothetical protein MUC56_00795 [Thermoanaerobaculales bacterium]|jgi:hypothetical protein|nr:hypothetical protein [Thermoanaerobaculales bacterium]